MNVLPLALALATAAPAAVERGETAPAPDPAVTATAAASHAATPEVYTVHLAVDIPVTVAAGSTALVRILFEDRLARKSCPCDPSGLNPIDRGAVGNDSAAAGVAANVTVYGVMAALPIADLIDVGFGRAWGEDLVVYAETIAIDTALQNAANFIVARPRPRTYAGDPAYLASGEGYLSFYAGHVSTAFASLSMAAFTVRSRHGEHVWPWVVAGVVASTVALERVASGDHFPTDVAVAAVMGTAIGVTVPWLHRRREQASISVTPVGDRGLGIRGRF